MSFRRLALRFFIFLRTVAWASPLAKMPFCADIFVRIGYLLRGWFGLVPEEGEIITIHGSKMMFGAASEAYIDMVQDAYEPEITRLFEELITPGMVVVDIGAHIGYFSLLAACCTGPDGKVYAFEPAPDNYHILVKNIALNNYQNIVPVQMAVCDIRWTTSFYIHQDTVAHSLYPTTIGRGKKIIEIETTSLDVFFRQEGWPTDLLVKIDAEGAELPTLKGMTDVIARSNTIYIILEFIPHIQRNAGIDPSDIISKLEKEGFTVRLINGSGLMTLNDKSYSDYNLQASLFCELVKR